MSEGGVYESVIAHAMTWDRVIGSAKREQMKRPPISGICRNAVWDYHHEAASRALLRPAGLMEHTLFAGSCPGGAKA